MWLLTYDGRRVESSARHPEQLTILAPEHLQEACVRFGGKTWQGKPKFRLVLVSSRYQIAGGHEFTFLDEHGNYIKTCPAEMLLPRYLAEPAERSLYLLERWRGPEWYIKNGWGGEDEIEWKDSKPIRCMEPVWPEGGYEAIYYKPAQLAVFPRNIGAENPVLPWMIHKALKASEMTKEAMLREFRGQKELEQQQDLDAMVDVGIHAGRPNIFLEPAVSYSGLDAKKEELWTQQESSVSAPATQ